MFFFPRSGRLELLRTAHAGEFDRPKTGNYDSDRQVTDCGRLDTKPAFLIGGRLIGASLPNAIKPAGLRGRGLVWVLLRKHLMAPPEPKPMLGCRGYKRVPQQSLNGNDTLV